MMFTASSPPRPRRRGVLAALATLAATALGGCLPTQGPSTAAIQGAAVAQNLPDDRPAALDYVLVRVDGSNIGQLSEIRGPGPIGRLGTRGANRPADIRIGVGDTVGVTIFETGAGGLFSPPEAAQLRTGNYVELPPQTVDRDGTISVPYAGQVRAAGRTPADVQATIVERLRNRAIEPQAVVTIREQRAAQVSVLGQVNAPAVFSLNPRGERVLDAIARAGGIKYEGHESFVTVQRGRQKATVPFNTLVSDPQSNIFIQPGDTVYVSRQVQSFIAIGASKQNGLVNFDAPAITLAQALGRTGGLLDDRADPTALFVYRFEGKDRLRRLGLETAPFAGHNVPVIYMLDFRDPSAPHLATRFQMADQDMLYVSNAPTVEVVKVINLIRGGTGIISDLRRNVDN